MKSLIVFFLRLLGFSRPPSASDSPRMYPRTLWGKCEYVQDGDSLRFLPDGAAESVRTRLYGIDAPEKGQDFAGQSRQLLVKLTRRKRIRVEVQDVDRYGRYVAKVYVGGTYVNEEMLRAGLAWFYSHHADALSNADLVAAEREAREARRGLWLDDSSMSPREYRNMHGTVHIKKEESPSQGR